jgi:PIN like domain
MGDPRQKSQRRFRGKSAKPLRSFTLYLDESFDCAEVKEALTKAKIKFKVFSDHFNKGENDQQILRLCGRHGWVLLTCDKRNRYRDLERKVVMQFRVRQFVFGGNSGGIQLAKLLVDVYPEMRRFARESGRPFVASVTRNKDIYLRMDNKGKAHSSHSAVDV